MVKWTAVWYQTCCKISVESSPGRLKVPFHLSLIISALMCVQFHFFLLLLLNVYIQNRTLWFTCKQHGCPLIQTATMFLFSWEKKKRILRKRKKDWVEYCKLFMAVFNSQEDQTKILSIFTTTQYNNISFHWNATTFMTAFHKTHHFTNCSNNERHRCYKNAYH